MTGIPRVSIITPSYDQADYLEQTIRSVLDQNYPDLEYLVIDGGSSDGSVDIIRKYAGRLAFWVSEPDKGQADAINKGLARATGEVVAWLNSDDVYRPGAIQAAASLLQADPAVMMTFGDVDSIDSEGRVFNRMIYGDWGLDELLGFNIIGQAGVFFRRSALEKTGLLDPSFHYLLDHHLWLRLGMQGEIRYTHQTWAAARIHPEAKNVAHAASFGGEAYRIIDWMQNQPDLNGRIGRLRRRVWAGAHRFNARYLLDGGKPRQALAFYLRSLAVCPPVALKESNRILYAAAASLGLNFDGVKQFYLAWRQRRMDKRDLS